MISLTKNWPKKAFQYSSMKHSPSRPTFNHTHHDGGCSWPALPSPPALSDIRTLCLLTHGAQPEASQVALQLTEILPDWNVCFEPRRQPQSLSFLPLEVLRSWRGCLDEVAETRAVSDHLHLLGTQRGLATRGLKAEEQGGENSQLL